MTQARLVLATLVALALTAAVLLQIGGPDAGPANIAGTADAAAVPEAGGRYRDFTLEIVPTDLDTGAGLWHAWTYDGQVPGPTLEAEVGDVLRVTVVNHHDITHSLHTHLVPAGLASDGSQLNSITGIGGMAMIAPGESYTYWLKATVAGLNYYHCHSADGGHTISEHMAQGLYGAILIKERGAAPIHTEVVMMGERAFDVDSPDAPYFVMNGKGLPGGEHELERVFAEQGVPGVVAQLGHTVPIMRGRVGEEIEIAIVNIGDAVHSFHLHGMTAYSQEQQPGRPVPAQVVQLAPGAVDRIRLTPTDAGLWLFHCHVVSHADQGMIGVFIVDPREGELALPEPAAPMHSTHATDEAAANATPIEIHAGGAAGELRFAPPPPPLAPGTYAVTFVNDGRTSHSLSFPALGKSTGTVASGGQRTIVVTFEPGTYDFICAEPGHAGAGMSGRLTIA